jgi:hypothetical protein
MISIFENYPNHLDKGYDLLLEDSFSKGFWKNGEYKAHRIKWKNAVLARKELDSFHKSGIYIWGYEQTPLYVGKAEKKPFSSRFNRYVFSSKSQCKVGEIYSSRLKEDFSKLSVNDLRKEFGISKSRALGAKIFGELGVNKIWFIIIPVDVKFITHLETELIFIAENWNKEKGYRDLINLERIKKNQNNNK